MNMNSKYLKTWANNDAEFDLESYQSVPPCLMMGGGSDVLCQFQTVSQWPGPHRCSAWPAQTLIQSPLQGSAGPGRL